MTLQGILEFKGQLASLFRVFACHLDNGIHGLPGVRFQIVHRQVQFFEAALENQRLDFQQALAGKLGVQTRLGNGIRAPDQAGIFHARLDGIQSVARQ